MLPWQRQHNAARAIGNQGERGFRWAASKIFFDSLAEGASRPKGAGKRHEMPYRRSLSIPLRAAWATDKVGSNRKADKVDGK